LTTLLAHRPKSTSKHKELVAVVAVMLLAATLRVGWPGLTEFKFSEARLEALALEITREGRLPLVGVPSSAGVDHSPISVYLYAPAFLLATNPIPATVYGGLVNVLVVALCWRAGRRWPGGSARAAFAAALLLAVSPWATLFGRKIWQIAFVPALALAFTAWAVDSLVLGRRWRLCASVTAYAILAQVHPSAVSLAPAFLLWLFLCWRRNLALPLLAGVVLGTCTGIPFVLHQAQTGWGIVDSLQGLGAAVWDLSALRLAWRTITGQGIEALAGVSMPRLKIVPEITPLLSIGGWLLVGCALALAYRVFRQLRAADAHTRMSGRVDIILLTSLVTPILFSIRHSLELQHHFFALILPAGCLILGRALGCQAPLAGKSVWPRIGLFRAANSLAWLATSLHLAFQVTVLLLMGAFVAEHDTTGGFGRPLSHYLKLADTMLERARHDEACDVLVVAEGSSPVVHELPAIFDVLLRDRMACRFVDGRVSAVFPACRSVLLVAPGAGEASSWYGVWSASELIDGFRLYLSDGSWPRSFKPIKTPRLLQNGIEFQAYSWKPAMAAHRIWLLWQVHWEAGSDSHFYVHLVDAQGGALGQRDIAGLDSTYRRAGDHVVTLFDITASGFQPDPIWAQVGMYTYPGLEGISVIDAAGNPTAAEVRLGPLDGKSSPQ